MDRFRFTDRHKRGDYICGQCQAGDGFQFVMKYKGLDFKGALDLIGPIVGYKNGTISQEVLDKIAEKKRRTEEAAALWKRGVPITRGCPAGIYLTRRTGILEYPSSLRSVENLAYYEGGKELARYPVMIGAVVGPSGKLVNVHRTYLTAEGQKAPIEGVRKMMSGAILGGSAIRLWSINGANTVLVSEGIETAISAARVHKVPAWALISADQMRAWVPPQGVQHIIVAGDNDVSFTGHAAAYCLANRLVVQFKVPKVEVSIPMDAGKDWNDVWVCNNS